MLRVNLIPHKKRLFHLLNIIFFLLALGPFFFLAGRFFIISLGRIHVFYELEFQEGDMALACHRYLKGLPLYPDPEQGFVHLTYPPVVDVITSFAMLIVRSKKLWVGRLVSFLFTMGVLLTLFKWVWRETRSLAGAVFAALVYLAYYPMTGYWYDIFRPDSGFIFFSLLGCYLLTWKYPGRQGLMAGVAGALIFSIAVYTKQSAVLFGGVAFIIHVLLYHNKIPMVTALVGLLTSLLILLYLYATNPFFHVQCIQILLEHFKNLESWHNRLDTELIRFTLIPTVMIFLWYVSSLAGKRWRVLIHLALFGTGIYAGLKGLFKIGGYKNNYIPIVAFLSLGMGLALGGFHAYTRKKGALKILQILLLLALVIIGYWYLQRIIRNLVFMRVIIFILLALAWGLWIFLSEEKRWLTFAARVLLFLCLFLWGGILCHQWGALTLVRSNEKWKLNVPHPISLNVPHRDIVKQSWRVLERIQKLPGSVYILHHNYYTWLIGRPIFYPVDTIRDLTLGRGTKMIPRNCLKALNERRFDFIILDNQIGSDWLDTPIRNAIQKNYEQMENLETMGWRLLRPVDETAMKPRVIWRRKDWKEKNPSPTPPSP